jgi:hypothetical protein
MATYFRLSQTQLEHMKCYFPLARGEKRVDDRRVISGIIHVIRRDSRLGRRGGLDDTGGCCE